MEPAKTRETYNKLKTLLEEASALKDVSNLLEWDQVSSVKSLTFIPAKEILQKNQCLYCNV
jgi:hypothetical protein